MLTNTTAASVGGQHRVLVVDDDCAIRLHARIILENSGIDVVEVGSGEQAIDILKRQRVDAVLLDVRMPGMDGFETCRQMRSMYRGDFLPIIVATGLDDREAIEAAYEAGATDFIAKPIDWTQLKYRIRYSINTRVMAEELAASHAHRQGLMQTIPDAVFSLDGKGRVTGGRLPASGWGDAAALFRVGYLLSETLPAGAGGLADQAVSAVNRGTGQASFEFDVQSSAGPRCYEVNLAAGGRGDMIALVRDFTDRRRAEAEIRSLAYFDRLTGMPNREMLQQFAADKLNAFAGTSSQLALMRLDLQGLEYTRCLLGNERANRLLCLFSERLNAVAGGPRDAPSPSPSLVGRVSDGGFAVVRGDLGGREAVRAFAKRLREEMAGSYTLGDYEIEVTTPLGIAVWDGGADMDALTLFDQAEMAMAQSCSTATFYSNEIRDQRRKRARLVKQLQSAVNNGDLHLEYQPKVDAGDRSLFGVEALVRWVHPERGAVSPAEFIPLAEESGLILSIGEFVLDEACRQSRQWNAAGRVTVPIAVNFSGHQFSKKGLVQGVMATLAKHVTAEGQIEIELTETVAMEHCAGIALILQDLQEIGIRTAIDDFGTGYSSLNNLRQFQFHTLKIDRSFVADLGHNPSARSIIRGIIDMSHALGMQVVAEGVEEDHQLEYLRSQRCDLIQGYLTGRPARGEVIQGLLKAA